jgi:Fe-S oxidoreductase
MQLEDATGFTAKCFHGEPASCSFACPFHLDIRSFLERAAQGKWAVAYKALRNATVFPAIVAALCDQPCSAHCQRTLLGDEAIAVRDVEAACVRYSKNRKPDSYAIPPKTHRIAIVGAGPAGLACALNLAQKKFSVTVFERENGWGGALRSHSKFAEFDADIALQFSAVKADFRYGTEIKTFDALAEFDAVYIATGGGGNDFGLLPGWDRELLCTGEPKAFLGGELSGVTLMEGMAQGAQASKTIEVFLQTGKAARTYGGFDRKHCERYLKHEGVASAPRVIAAGADGYTEAEAKAEAGRCLLCDCDKCLAACEMLKRFRKEPHKLAVEVYADTQVHPPFSSHTLTREAYSCNLCGYCQSICPEQVDLGGLLQLSRSVRAGDGSQPAALHDFWLREMDLATSEAAFAAAPQGRATCEYAFYPGCQLGASTPQHVREAYAFLRAKYDAGLFLGCCGAPAYWAGDDERLRANAERIRQAWNEMGRPRFVFACASCENMFHMFLPEVPRISLYELLAQAGAANSGQPFLEAAVFDPCAARDRNGMQAAVRTLAGKAGITLEELKEPNRCCGYGGHIRLANPELYDEIAKNRAAASEKPYIVYCANCREVFVSRGKTCVHVLDVAFGLEAGRPPSLQEKRENRLRVKKELMKEYWGMDFSPEAHEWDDLNLTIAPALLESMNQKLITAADVKEAIWRAESAGDAFYNEKDGMRICSMVKPVITYWVQYKEAGPKAYEIFSAYYHRMRFQEG